MNVNDPIPAPRGEATRAALIRAAIEAFGRDGFDAASTRAIAEAAGANQALIGYHFGGKSGLYLAALQHIVERIRQRVGPLVASIEAELGRPDAAPAAERALVLLDRLLEAFLEMLVNEESAAWARLILREQQDPSDGFDLLYSSTMQRLLAVMTGLIGRVRGAPAEAGATRLTALTLVGQVLVFRVARAAILRQMGWSRIGPEELQAVRAELLRNTHAILMESAQQ